MEGRVLKTPPSSVYVLLSEDGKSLALDFGSHHLRLELISLDKGKCEVDSKNGFVPEKLLAGGTAEEVGVAISTCRLCVDVLIDECGSSIPVTNTCIYQPHMNTQLTHILKTTINYGTVHLDTFRIVWCVKLGNMYLSITVQLLDSVLLTLH